MAGQEKSASRGGRGSRAWTTRAGGKGNYITPLSDESEDDSPAASGIQPVDNKRKSAEDGGASRKGQATGKPGSGNQTMKSKNSRELVKATRVESEKTARDKVGGRAPASGTDKTAPRRGGASGRSLTRPSSAGQRPWPIEQSPSPTDGPDLVPRVDHKFLQDAYEGVQEQNAKLLKLLENLTESHERVLQEKETTQKETKRLREVRPLFREVFLGSLSERNNSTKCPGDSGLVTPRSENSVVAFPVD